MSDDEDRTIISRAAPPIDDEATTISRPPTVDDDATTITRAAVVDDDATTITRAPIVDDEATTVSRGGAASGLDDRTVLSGRPTEVDDRTIASVGRAAPIDDATLIRGAPRPRLEEATMLSGDRAGQPRAPRSGAPGRLSGGRVAVVPGDKVERYQVRDSVPVIDNVVRTVIPAPAPSSPARQSRNTAAIEQATKRKTAKRGAGVIIAIVAVTVLALAVVAGVIAVLFLL